MNSIRSIRSIKNLNIDDKAKTKEQYEIITNVSMQEIKRLELCIILQEETMDKYSDVELDIKCFLKYLKYFNVQKIPGKIYFIPNYYNEKFSLKKYSVQRKFFEELENLFRENQKNYEKEIIKSKQKEIHQEKFKMCIHKLKLSLPDHLIYEIGTFM